MTLKDFMKEKWPVKEITQKYDDFENGFQSGRNACLEELGGMEISVLDYDEIKMLISRLEWVNSEERDRKIARAICSKFALPTVRKEMCEKCNTQWVMCDCELKKELSVDDVVLLKQWLEFAKDVEPSCAAGTDWLQGLRMKTENYLAQHLNGLNAKKDN